MGKDFEVRACPSCGIILPGGEYTCPNCTQAYAGAPVFSLRFKNPANNYTVSTSAHGLWCLLFGPFYFVKHGIWSHAVISFCLAWFTWGVSWLVYPIATRRIVEASYLRRGWIKLGK